MVRDVHNWKINKRSHPHCLQVLWHIISHTEICDYQSISKVNIQKGTKEIFCNRTTHICEIYWTQKYEEEFLSVRVKYISEDVLQDKPRLNEDTFSILYQL
jgi:hypothetical protein